MPDEPRQTPEEIAEEARQKINQVDIEFDERLRELEKRAEASKQTRENKQFREAKSRASDAEAAKGLGVGMTAAYAIIGMPIFGLGVGWAIEKFGGRPGWQSGCILVGAFLGVGYAVWFLQKTQK